MVIGRKLQFAGAWSGPLFLVLYGLFFGAIGGFIPPHPPGWSAEHVAQYYEANRTDIRIGQVGGMMASGLLLPFFGVIIGHLRRIESGRTPLLTTIGVAGLAVLEMLFLGVAMLWLVATYRADLDPDTLRMLHDLCWLIFVMAVPSYMLQLIVVGIAAFQDTSDDPVWPRWMGYLCFWVTLTGFGGLFAVFVKDGPLAWNGVVGFWIPIADFVMWVFVVTYLMHAWLRRNPEAN